MGKPAERRFQAGLAHFPARTSVLSSEQKRNNSPSLYIFIIRKNSPATDLNPIKQKEL